jgi:hypothetical protein
MKSWTDYSTQTPKKSTLFSGQYLRNHWTLHIGVLGYFGIVWPKEHSPEVRSFPPGTPCIYILLLFILFGCYLCCSAYCLCVNVYCHRVKTQLQLINITYIYIYICVCVCVCVWVCIYVFCVWISEQTAIISLYSINWLVFITETECVYCAVRTGYLNAVLRSAHTVYLCVLCGSENKQRLFPYTALTDWFSKQRRSVYTARYK